MIEEEIVHWKKDENGEIHKTILRIESSPPLEINGFPKDGNISIFISNSTGSAGIKLTPAEALHIGTQLLSISKDLLNQKRKLWQKKNL